MTLFELISFDSLKHSLLYTFLVFHFLKVFVKRTMSFIRIALSGMTFGRMTFGRMTFSGMALSGIIFG
jgi:hypothetical protein